MGKQNLIVNQLLERKENFEDLVNGCIFGGMQVVNPEERFPQEYDNQKIYERMMIQQ